jgi:23S rRNA (cytidine1920-2'-O)/16S rRNA (cytidine1409-2'-O)-methyltransferase
MKKERIDLVMVERGLAETRAKAQALVMAGEIFLDKHFSHKVAKPSEKILPDAEIFIKAPLPYVSRGGLKLAGAIDKFKIVMTDKVVLDVGASTGGFTDCSLKHGARKVFALDVGKSLIDYKLQKDNRVVIIEECNFRYVDFEIFTEKIDFVTIDVSFISLKLILPNVAKVLENGGEVVALIKPQFEVGKGESQKGIVKDEKKREKVKNTIVEFAKELGFKLVGTETSPIKGGKGNVEYLMYLKK